MVIRADIIALTHLTRSERRKFSWSVSPMKPPRTDSTRFVYNSVLYKEFIAEREEILCHKWIESEKAGHDVGFDHALVDWILKYRSAWRERRHSKLDRSHLICP
jgi:hypothetical protein